MHDACICMLMKDIANRIVFMKHIWLNISISFYFKEHFFLILILDYD